MKKELISKLMKEAVKEAEIAVNSGSSNRPFGAVLSDKAGKIIVRAHNTTKSDLDITAHAEMNLLKKAFKKLKTVDLSQYIIVVNAEPCSMCATACIKAGIRKFYYGLPMEKNSNPFIGLREIAAKTKGKLLIKGGIDISRLSAKIES
jgi:tRNA(Arg) A34 adenosine deaminase TadA